MKRALLLLALLLTVTGALAGSATAADAAPAATERLPSLDRQILVQINATRVSHGLRPLTLSGELEEAAVAHSRSMLEGGFFAHDSRDGSPFAARLKHFYRTTGYSSWSSGENLLYSTGAIDAEAAIKAWLDSPAHRENMLAPSWREVGIGSFHASSAGGQFGGAPTWVITVDFGARTGGAANPAAAKPAARTAVKPEPVKTTRPKAEKPTTAKTQSAVKPARSERPKPEQRMVDRVLPLPSSAQRTEVSAGPDVEDEGQGADKAHDVGGDEDDGPLEP